MTHTRTPTDDGSTAGKTTQIIQTFARADADPSESDSSIIDPKGGEKED